MLGEGSLILFGGFALLLFMGAPLAVALGFTGAIVVLREGLGIMAVPTNAYAGIAKYPLLALPVFVLAGLIFERAGVAERLVRFVSLLVGKRAGVGRVYGIHFSGLPAWILWRMVYLSKMPGWRQRTRILMDWILDFVFGRNAAAAPAEKPSKGKAAAQLVRDLG